jgi:hypothetical protein
MRVEELFMALPTIMSEPAIGFPIPSVLVGMTALDGHPEGFPMTEENPYQTPTAGTEGKPPKVPKRWSVIILSAISFQLLIAALYATTLISRFRHGEISGLTCLMIALASVFLASGGLLHYFGSRMAGHAFLLATVLGALGYLQWRPPFVFTGLVISTCAWLLSLATRKVNTKT